MRTGQRFVVRGRVQGVGFRAATVREARRLGITGWVRNDARGFVDVLACGETAVLRMLHSWLQHGPEFARVDQVECHDCDAGDYPDFRIA